MYLLGARIESKVYSFLIVNVNLKISCSREKQIRNVPEASKQPHLEMPILLYPLKITLFYSIIYDKLDKMFLKKEQWTL